MLKAVRYSADCKLQSIPFHWDMETFGKLCIEHQLDFNNIVLLGDRPIEITIVDDTQKCFTGLGLGGGGYRISQRNLELWRPKFGYFHGPKFKRTDIVRGYIVILYKHV